MNLLDPMDSLRVSDYVGPLAQKFRIILSDILDPNNADATTAFIQFSNSQELTLKILNEFLSGEYFILNEDGTGQMNLDLVEIDAGGNPVKFKPEAARRILVMLGILQENPDRMGAE